MYISVYPVVITMRHSNVYEERSLGIYSAELSSSDPSAPSSPSPPSPSSSGNGSNNKSHNKNADSKAKSKSKKAQYYGEFKRTLSSHLSLSGIGGGKGERGEETKGWWTTTERRRREGKEFVQQQIRAQLSHDIWWLVIAVFLISCLEVGNFDRDPVTYSYVPFLLFPFYFSSPPNSTHFNPRFSSFLLFFWHRGNEWLIGIGD